MINLPLKSQVGFGARNALAKSFSVAAPVGGLNTRDAEAAMRPIYATLMENFWPQEQSVGIRKGAVEHCPTPEEVKTVGMWSGAASRELIAFTDAGAYNVTAEAVSPPSVAQAFTSGDMVLANYAVSGGSYLVGVNGVDSYFYYKSPTWTTVSTFNVANGSPSETIATSNLSYVAMHQRSLFFIEKDSMNFYFLPINSITGDLNRFPVGGLFRKGGKLKAIGSWTIDGADGPDDMCVLVTTEGQAAVYSGTDPSTAGQWSLRGVFDVGTPLGKNPFYKLGGDLLILTTFGVISLAKLSKEGWVSSKSTITDIISSYFQQLVQGTENSSEWQITANPKLSLLLVNVPATETRERIQLAMNLVTGAWTVFRGWQTTSWELFEGTLYAGTGDGVIKVWTVPYDFGSRIPCYVRCAWTYLTPKARTKKVNLIRFLMRVSGELGISAGLDSDFAFSNTFYPIDAQLYPLSRFNNGTWDNATWGAYEQMQVDWLSVPCLEGFCLAPSLRVYAGDATFQWSAIDYAYTTGSIGG